MRDGTENSQKTRNAKRIMGNLSLDFNDAVKYCGI